MRFDVEVRVSASIDRVWPYLAEPDRWLEYTPALIERTRLNPGPIEPGAVWRSVDRVGPVRIEFTDELIAIDHHRSVAFRQSAPWNSWGEFTIRTADAGSVVRVHFEGRPSGRIWWLNLMPNALAANGYKKDLMRLARLFD